MRLAGSNAASSGGIVRDHSGGGGGWMDVGAWRNALRERSAGRPAQGFNGTKPKFFSRSNDDHVQHSRNITGKQFLPSSTCMVNSLSPKRDRYGGAVQAIRPHTQREREERSISCLPASINSARLVVLPLSLSFFPSSSSFIRPNPRPTIRGNRSSGRISGEPESEDICNSDCGEFPPSSC